MSRPAGSRMKALDANAISVIACLTKPPFALAARVLPRVTAIFALCYNNAGVAAAVMWSSVARGVCYNNAGVGAAVLWSRVAISECKKRNVSVSRACSAEIWRCDPPPRGDLSMLSEPWAGSSMYYERWAAANSDIRR